MTALDGRPPSAPTRRSCHDDRPDDRLDDRPDDIAPMPIRGPSVVARDDADIARRAPTYLARHTQPTMTRRHTVCPVSADDHLGGHLGGQLDSWHAGHLARADAR